MIFNYCFKAIRLKKEYKLKAIFWLNSQIYSLF